MLLSQVLPHSQIRDLNSSKLDSSPLILRLVWSAPSMSMQSTPRESRTENSWQSYYSRALS